MSLYIFDMGEVLMLGVETLPKMAKEYGMAFKELRADFAYYDKPLNEGYMAIKDYYKHLKDCYGIDVKGDPFKDYFTPKLNYGIFPIIDSLRARGDRTVIGSNTFAPHWNMLNGRYKELKNHFDSFYASHIMHITKPSLAFWKKIMDKEGYSAEDTFFIDDRKENIDAAISLGIRCFEYHKNDEELKAFLGL